MSARGRYGKEKATVKEKSLYSVIMAPDSLREQNRTGYLSKNFEDFFFSTAGHLLIYTYKYK